LYSIEGHVPEELYSVPIGEAVVRTLGTDVTIVATSYAAHLAVQAHTILGIHGISAEVIDLRSAKPIDVEKLATSVSKTGRALIVEYDKDRFLGHIPKVTLIKGDMIQTIPEFVRLHPHLVVSLLFIDCDLYEATKVALENLLPRMPKGAVLAFDDLDNPLWPGETLAVLDVMGIRNLRFRRLEWDPYIAFATLE
jgi:hypothetical protein